MRSPFILLITACWILVPAGLPADIIEVPDEAPTIQAGIDLAAEGDTVLVAEGTYQENIDYTGKDVFVTSGFLFDQNKEIIISTVIDGQGESVATFENGETRDAVLYGFTLTTQGDYCVYCEAASPTIMYNRIIDCSVYHWGAGVSCWNGASPIISHNVFADDFAYHGGGAVFAYYSQPVIRHNVIRMCEGQYGGAICSAWYSESLIEKNIITDCRADAAGGGIHLSSRASQVLNNTIIRNNSSRGAGVHTTDYATSVIKNNIIAFNEDGAGILVSHFSEPVVSFNDVYGNEGGDYGDWEPGPGDISCDPRFRDSSPADVNLSALSPCIDAADPATEVPWFGGDRRDMGAREYHYLNPGQLLSFSDTPAEAEIGSTASWEVMITNPFAHPITFDGWVEVSGPECGILGALYDISLPAHGHHAGILEVFFPLYLSEGDYVVKGRLGVLGDELWDGEVFDVELSSSANIAGQ